MTTVRAHQLSPEEFWAQGGPGTILAKHGKTFNWARRFLGQGQGDKAARLYAFCRYLDDIADGDVNGGSAALTDIQDMLAQRQAVDDPLWRNSWALPKSQALISLFLMRCWTA